MEEMKFDVGVRDLYKDECANYYNVTELKYKDGVLEFIDECGKWTLICTKHWMAAEV